MDDRRERELLGLLKRHWGHSGFRPGQRQAVESVLDGRDTLVLMPTGAGKSLLYQLPALMLEGVCIVVTPLVALMKDQVDGLRAKGISAVAVHSGLSPRYIDIQLDNCVYGDTKFLYIAPERIRSDVFMMRVAKMKVCLVAVDEAHCISQWGYDFRPAYLSCGLIRKSHPDAPVVALTASATPTVAGDIMNRLGFREPHVIRTDYSRPNLSYAVRNADDKAGQLQKILRSVPGSGIVYVRTREGTEKLAAELNEAGFPARSYHAGLPHGERSARQEEWTSGKCRVMVATNAFGMGIDKADVRYVVHWDMCSSLEEYYQEAGRAGRDGRRSYAVLLSAPDEKGRAMRRFQSEYPTMEQIKSVYESLHNYLQVGIGDGKYSSYAFNIYDFCSKNRYFTGTALHALKILQQNGYLVLTDESENPARLMFCVPRDDLYSLRIRRSDLDDILRAILRLYTGVFTEFRPIDTQELAVYTGYTEERVRELLKILWQLRVIRYIPKNTSPTIMLTEERLPIADVVISPQTYALRKQAAAERLAAMLGYAENAGECRSAVLQRYFGQEDAEDCGVCDICLSRKRKPASEDEALKSAVLRLLADRPLTVRELALRTPAKSEKIASVLDELAAAGKISLGTDGTVRKNG